jgi:hypothetical protein
MKDSGSVQPAMMTNQHPFYQNKIAWFPICIYEKGNEHNSTKVAARWLCFLISDAMSVGLDFSLDLDLSMLSLRIGIPWVNFYIRFPMPHKLDMWAHRNLWRVGERSKFKWMR